MVSARDLQAHDEYILAGLKWYTYLVYLDNVVFFLAYWKKICHTSEVF